MAENISRQIERIRRYGINCTINDNGLERTFQDGYEYVDLGLPSGTKWSTMNLGGDSITDNGGIYRSYRNDNNLDTVFNAKFKIPSMAQFDELITNTVSLSSEINGVKGRKCISKTDNSKWIFLPYGCLYWFCRIIGGEYIFGENYAFCFKFNEGNAVEKELIHLSVGVQVRGVLE
jgi:hypothetical protein